jgi:hypothetical protein
MRIWGRATEGRELFVLGNRARAGGGTVRIDFSFLINWIGDKLARTIANTLELCISTHRSPGGGYAVRDVFRCWIELASEHKARANFTWPEKPDAASRLLRDLKRGYFEYACGKGRGVSYANAHWGDFVRYLRFAHTKIGFPDVHDWQLFGALPRRLVEIDRTAVVSRKIEDALVPRTMDIEGDSYHTDLLVPISLALEHDDYLEQYTASLKSALDVVRSCAMKEFEELCEKQQLGERLVETTDYQRLTARLRESAQNGDIDPWRYRDPETGVHMLDEASGHPNLLGNVLSIIRHEMGSIPQPYTKVTAVEPGKSVTSYRKGKKHWSYIEQYGKNRIAPYLGILNASSAVPLMLLLMLEHPNLNFSSIARAKLGAKGKETLLTTAGEDDSEVRISVDKLRALAEKGAILTSLSRRIISVVMQWTAPLREQLVLDGRHEDAEYLWLGLSHSDYKIIVLTEQRLWAALKQDRKDTSYAYSTKSKLVPFIARHPELKPFNKLNFRSIRASTGVLDFLESNGDLVATARAFGHANVRMSIDRYVPKAIQEATYERQIRRHQNLLIMLAMKDCEDALQLCDFPSYEMVHGFLRSIGKQFHIALADADPETILKKLRAAVCPAPKSHHKSKEQPEEKPLLLLQDERGLAVAILYRDHLKKCSPEFRQTLDARTGTVPQMWSDLIEALECELPVANREIANLMVRAREKALILRHRVQFPEPK